MYKPLIVLSACLLSACSSIDFKSMTVDEVVSRSIDKRLHVWATTEFLVSSTQEGSCQHANKWMLSTAQDHRAHRGLTIQLAPQVVPQFKRKYGIEAVEQLEGKKVQVTGTAFPNEIFACSDRPNGREKLYVQTQMIIEDIENITVL